MNKNPFYEIFKGYIPKLIFIIFILICVNNIIPFVCDMRDYFWNNREGLIFINRTSDICYIGVFLLTLIFTNNFLLQMLNIRGDRDACIKSFFKMMIIVIIIAVVSGVVVEFSLDYICKLYNVTEADALKMMVDIDKRRMTNYRFYTDRKWGMAGNYTLSLNSSELGYDMCEKIIMDCATL